jgi:hypothetical protein
MVPTHQDINSGDRRQRDMARAAVKNSCRSFSRLTAADDGG